MSAMPAVSRTFPLEPLRTVRTIRVRTHLAELQRRRREHADAEAQRERAAEQLQQARDARAAYCARAWRGLLADGSLTALATDRHEKRLALLDQQIEHLVDVLDSRERTAAETLAEVETAAAAWRQAHRKLEAVEEMRRRWQQQANTHAELQEERGLEELSTRRASFT